MGLLDETKLNTFYPKLGGDAIPATVYASHGPRVGAVKFDAFGNKYRFIKYIPGASAPTAAIGMPMGVYMAGSAGTALETELTADLSDSAEAVFRGLAASLFSATNIYGWVMVSGDIAKALGGAGITVVTDGNVAQADALYWAADLKLYGLAVGGSPADRTFCGSAGEADASTTLAVGRIFESLSTNMAA